MSNIVRKAPELPGMTHSDTRADFRCETSDGWFVSGLAKAAELGPGPCVLSPLTATLPPGLADMACALPIGDANGQLLAELRSGRPDRWVLAGVFGCDPFRRVDDLVAELCRVGVAAVTNWPTIGLLSGELGSALQHSGFSYGRELELLARSRERGMYVAAVVSTGEQLEQARTCGPDMLIVTPGLAREDAAAMAQQGRRLGEELIPAARSALPDADVRLYLHPLFGAALEPLRSQVEGVVRHAGDHLPE